MLEMSKIILISFALNLIFFICYIKFNPKNYINFLYYFLYFLTYNLALSIIYYFFEKNFTKIINIQSATFSILYILFFISFFLTASVRYIKSPTYLIFNKLKEDNKTSLIDLIICFKKNKVLKIRIKDLKKQKIIEFKNGSMELKKNLAFTIYIIFFIKKFYKLKSEG